MQTERSARWAGREKVNTFNSIYILQRDGKSSMATLEASGFIILIIRPLSCHLRPVAPERFGSASKLHPASFV